MEESLISTETETLKKKVVAALKEVYDPEIPVDILELGLIYQIDIYPLQHVRIIMTLTSPACPVAEQLPEEVRSRVAQIADINHVDVELTFEPPYTQDMMSEVAKIELGLF